MELHSWYYGSSINELWSSIIVSCSPAIIGLQLMLWHGFDKQSLSNLKSIKTRMWSMISSPATPTVCLEQKSVNFQSRNVTLSMPSPSKKIVFEIICNVAYHSAARFTFPIEQPSNKATKCVKCGIRWSWKLTESWLLWQHSYSYSLHFSFCFILIIPRLTVMAV